jgi:anti-sigma factor RsiW
MTVCTVVRADFADYLDGRLTGHQMQSIGSHLRECAECTAEFEAEQQMLRALASLGSIGGDVREPDNMVLRIRVAVGQARAQSAHNQVARWRMAWQNSLGPFLLQASAGFASAVLLLASVTLLVGMFARPEPASAQDEPLGMRSAPRLRYHSGAAPDVDQIGAVNGPVVVEAYVNGSGRVYDYRIVSGPNDAATRSQVENLLLFSVFEPARFFGQPVSGLAVLSFSGVSVHG